MLAARRNRRYKGNHHDYREAAVCIKLLYSHCFELRQSIKEEPRGHQGSLDWHTRCFLRNTLHRMASCLFPGSYSSLGQKSRKLKDFAHTILPTRCEISSEGIFNTPRKEFLTLQKKLSFCPHVGKSPVGKNVPSPSTM